jgi:hypothetical protein
MIAACHTGPVAARVAAVAQSDARDEGWRDFAQRPTGED